MTTAGYERCRAVRVASRILALAAVALLAACSGKSKGFGAFTVATPETAVSYEVELVGSPDDTVTGLAEQSLSSYRQQKDGAPSLAFLRRRAQSDVPELLKILRSEGYYSASAEAAVEELEPGKAKVVITAEPGPGFILTRHTMMLLHDGLVAPPELDAKELGSPVDGQARAAAIAGAEGAAVARLTAGGFPYARFLDREGLADPGAATLTVDSRINAGGGYRFGPIAFEGDMPVPEEYLLTYRPWEEGDTFDSTLLRQYQRDLVGTGLFRAVSVSPPDQEPENNVSPEGDPLPMTVILEEGLPRTVAGGLRYDTDLGPSVRASFEHRNFLGRNEKFTMQADAGLVRQQFGLGLRKPQYLRPGQDLVANLTLLRTTEDAFDADSAIAFLGVERELSDHWKAGVGVLGEYSIIDDDNDDGDAVLLGVPGTLAYEDTDSLLDPRDGQRWNLAVTPFAGAYDGSDTQFLVVDTIGSAYRPLDDARQYVFAARARLGTIVSSSLGSVPPTRRLYSGGGGSVRGYAEKMIGPLDEHNNPIGGRSVIELGAELRAPIWGDIGGAIFAGAGSVSEAMYPDFADGVQTAAGVGLRYASPAGPIRVDVAVPINPRGADDPFQVYFSIGQAF